MPAATSMRTPVAAEAAVVEQKPATRSRKTAAQPRAAATKRPAPRRRATPPPPPAPPSLDPGAVILRVLLVAALAAAAAFLLLAGDRQQAPTTPEPAVVEAAELASFARERGRPVYWGGTIPGAGLELTETSSGVFVRYLDPGIAAGDERPALTVATYPMANAFATATRRADQPGMASRRTRNAGIAVWHRDRPTSVYVAFRGSPALVEVFAPDAREARALALSGSIRPAR